MRNTEEKPDPARRHDAGCGPESEERRRWTNSRDQSQGMTEMTPASEAEARAGGDKTGGNPGHRDGWEVQPTLLARPRPCLSLLLPGREPLRDAARQPATQKSKRGPGNADDNGRTGTGD